MNKTLPLLSQTKDGKSLPFDNSCFDNFLSMIGLL